MSSIRARLELRGLVEGTASGELLVLRSPLSFYGEVDPETGRIHGVGDSLAGRLLVIPSTRGSTVGPYVLYALSRKGLAPCGIVVSEAEPLLVAGAVLAEIPLAAGIDKATIDMLAEQECSGSLVSEPPKAVLDLACK